MAFTIDIILEKLKKFVTTIDVINSSLIKISNIINLNIFNFGINLKKIDGSPKQISSGPFGVFGVNKNDDIFFRKGITSSNPYGTSWDLIEGKLKQISCGEFGLWGINSSMEIFCRKSISKENPKGTNWTKIDGAATHISVGYYGIWVISADKRGEWVRNGVTSLNQTGNEWINISGALINISSRYFGIWGVNHSNDIYYRNGVNIINPKGDNLEKIDNKFKFLL